MVIWLIGLSGAGKTTVGLSLANKLREDGRACVFIDGDIVREIMGSDLGHSIEDRKKNADRICRLCKHLDTQGVDVVCGILSIFPESRKWNRENMSSYFETFLDAPIETLMQRDDKGLYARAQRGELRDVVGVDLPFPEPETCDLRIKNDFTQSPEELSSTIFEALSSRLQNGC